jgi:hypothetical protein
LQHALSAQTSSCCLPYGGRAATCVPVAPSHHADAVQDHPRAGWPSTRATRRTSTRGGGQRRIKAASIARRRNKQECRAVTYACGKGVHLLRAVDQRAMPWVGGGSSWRGIHIRHQNKARPTKGLGGRWVAAPSRRRDGEGGRWVAALGHGGDADRRAPRR